MKMAVKVVLLGNAKTQIEGALKRMSAQIFAQSAEEIERLLFSRRPDLFPSYILKYFMEGHDEIEMVDGFMPSPVSSKATVVAYCIDLSKPIDIDAIRAAIQSYGAAVSCRLIGFDPSSKPAIVTNEDGLSQWATVWGFPDNMGVLTQLATDLGLHSSWIDASFSSQQIQEAFKFNELRRHHIQTLFQRYMHGLAPSELATVWSHFQTNLHQYNENEQFCQMYQALKLINGLENAENLQGKLRVLRDYSHAAQGIAQYYMRLWFRETCIDGLAPAFLKDAWHSFETALQTSGEQEASKYRFRRKSVRLMLRLSDTNLTLDGKYQAITKFYENCCIRNEGVRRPLWKSAVLVAASSLTCVFFGGMFGLLGAAIGGVGSPIGMGFGIAIGTMIGLLIASMLTLSLKKNMGVVRPQFFQVTPNTAYNRSVRAVKEAAKHFIEEPSAPVAGL